MKLTNKDIVLLKSWGYENNDIAQIQRAISKMITVYEGNGKKNFKRRCDKNFRYGNIFKWNCKKCISLE